MLLALFNIYSNKKGVIKETVEDEKSFFTDKIYCLGNSFFVDFYSQSAESTVADAYEFFTELDIENNFFHSNIHLMDKERGRRFFKLNAMYHTIRFLMKRVRQISPEDMKNAMYEAYSMDEREQKLFSLLYDCAQNYGRQFPDLFSRAYAKYLFGKECGPFSVAFIENFCYNSYNKFYASFTKYMALNRRIERADSSAV